MIGAWTGGSARPRRAARHPDLRERERVLEAVRRVEREPALLGASAHLLVAGRHDAVATSSSTQVASFW